MSFSRKKFLHLLWKSCSILLVVPPDLISACTWKKKYEDPKPEPSVKEEIPEPYIPPPGQSLLLKTGQSSYTVGDEVEIKWEQTGLATVNIYFSSDEGLSWTVIATNVTATTGVYVWTVPLIISSLCLVRITNAMDEQLKSESSSAFRIKAVTTIDLSLYPSLQSVGGFEIVELFSITTIIIRETVTDFLPLSMHCTHNGCIINYNGSPGFNCSCHGSMFNTQGEVLQGPAQRNLPKFESNYSATDNTLTITI